MATEAVDTPVVDKAQEEMAEDSPKDDPAAADGSKPAEQPAEEGYDASLLVFVKGKAKRPARPDDAERNMQVQKLQEQIDKASARITEIKAILDSRGSSRGVVNPEVQACRDKIQQLRAEFDTVLVGTRAQPPHMLPQLGVPGGKLPGLGTPWGVNCYQPPAPAACRHCVLVKAPRTNHPTTLPAAVASPTTAFLPSPPSAAAHRCRRSA
jgi:hypothetical protein